MSYELFISLRYLKAKRKQTFVSIITFISIAGVTIGVMALIIVIGVMTGFEEDLKSKILGTNAHLIVLKYTKVIDDYQRITKEIESVEGVVAATPFIYSEAMLTRESGVSGVILRGIDPESARKVINLQQTLEEGSLEELKISPEKEESSCVPGIILGKELAGSLGVFYHDKVNVVSPFSIMTPMGMVPRIKNFQVVGIFHSGMYEYDAKFAYISLAAAQQFFNMPRSATGIEVKIEDVYQAKLVGKEVGERLGYTYLVKDWMDMNKNFFSALRLEKIVMFIILALIILVAAFGIISSLIMVVMEKNGDIAILKSMGATSSSIMKIFVFEGLIIGVVGTALGCIIGLTVSFNLDKIATLIEKWFGITVFPGDVYYIDKLPSQINLGDVVVIAATAIFISFLATFYPSWQASRLDPAEALRYE